MGFERSEEMALIRCGAEFPWVDGQHTKTRGDPFTLSSLSIYIHRSVCKWGACQQPRESTSMGAQLFFSFKSRNPLFYFAIHCCQDMKLNIILDPNIVVILPMI